MTHSTVEFITFANSPASGAELAISGSIPLSRLWTQAQQNGVERAREQGDWSNLVSLGLAGAH